MLRIGGTLRTVELTNLPEARSADQLEGAAAKIDGLMDAYRDAIQAQRRTEAQQLRVQVDSAFNEIDSAMSQLDQVLRLKPAAGDDRHLLGLIKEQGALRVVIGPSCIWMGASTPNPSSPSGWTVNCHRQTDEKFPGYRKKGQG